MKLLRLALFFLAATVAPLHAFNGHRVAEGPLTLTIDAVPPVTATAIPQPCRVVLLNSASTPLRVAVELTGLVDDCRVDGETRREVDVPAGATMATAFRFVCGPATYSGVHYPLQVTAQFDQDGVRRTAHAVQIFETRLEPAARVPQVVTIPANGVVALAAQRPQIVVRSSDGATTRMRPDWTGSDAATGTFFQRGAITRGGDARNALQLHPPYRPRAGTVFAEYRVQLPTTTPLTLQFQNAIRDSGPNEGISDGVTFRVWINDAVAFERHTDSKVWMPGSADLAAFAGQLVTLRFESHPGPRQNTTCDSSYWGDPVIVAGRPPPSADAAMRLTLRRQAIALLNAPAGVERLARFALEGGLAAALTLGPNGITDGAIAFGGGDRAVVFDGLNIAFGDHVLGEWPSAARVEAVEPRWENGKLRLVHRVRINDLETTLAVLVWADGPALRVKVECPEYITRLGLNAADQHAERVYYGHGYCIIEPQAFRASAGGHDLATSHVGFDFEGGIALVAASDTPVDHLQVDPARRLYRLETHPDATLTFVPGTQGAFDCAVRYQSRYDRSAAPGVAHKAGRFVFDVWGGRYAENTALLSRCFDYGLTDALVLVHNWQRWGYDYRLPDIFPPNPALGTLADLQELGRLCANRGVRWGLHDNYIDIYPDAEGFTYDHVTFSEEGRPRRAWLNESREAQSYQFRPDAIAPFLRRNLDLIVPALHPTASFVDVFSSLNSFDYHDRAGRFHPKTETQRAWGEAFATIRTRLGDDAPTVSEAGSDHLIGWLDGADAQVMQLADKPLPFHNVVRCRDWERVPWFDAVNHTRFSLHGVGYSERYQGGRSREEHGIESDDYLTAELLMGHALMVDRPAMARGAVRKYWLAQPFIRSVAADEIAAVEFVEGDVHRQRVRWRSGAVVCVNRGERDWTVEGHTLPQYGVWARNGAVSCSVERMGGAIVERSEGEGSFYVNARVFAPTAPAPITPRATGVEYLGGRKFRLLVAWDAAQGTAKPHQVFYHFSRATPGRRAMTEFVGGGTPALPTTEWRGAITTGAEWVVTIPPEMPLGDYDVLVGLYDPRHNGDRLRLQGDEDQRRRYRVARLTWIGPRTGELTGVRLEPHETAPRASARWLANTAPVAFGPVTTNGAFRCDVLGHEAIVTPLPDGEPFEVRVAVERIFGRPIAVRAIERLDSSRAVIGTIPVRVEANEIVFTTDNRTFAYRLRAE